MMIMLIITTIILAICVYDLEIKMRNIRKSEKEMSDFCAKLIDLETFAKRTCSIAFDEMDMEIDKLREYFYWRQYLIDTNFCGKLKDEKLLQEFVNIFPKNGLDGDTHEESFERFKETTLKLENIGSVTIPPYNDMFFGVINKLKELEKKQEILDDKNPKN